MTAEPTPTRLTGAEIAIRLLERQGVTTVAGIPGGAVLPLYDALARAGTIRHVLARHEQGAGFIAQGIARATGRPGVCIASSGPGATNLLTAIADAKLDSIPLVAITGQVPRALIGTDAFQEVDTFGLSLPVTKHNYLVRSARDLLRIIPAAFAIAASGRPGPVLIDIPKDVQNELVDVAEWPAPGVRAAPPAPSDDALARAAAMIEAAERPILYLGGGVVAANAARAALALAERSALPTVMTLMGLGCVPAEHPLALGMLGMHAAPYTNHALDECDLLIAVGARFDDRATGKLAEFCPRAAVIHVDVDAAELGKLRAPQLAIAADARAVLERLLPRLRARRRARWLARIRALKAAHPLAMPRLDSLRSPYGLVRAVAAALDDDALVATDVGQHQMWVAQSFPLRRARQWLTSGGLGTMGFGLPAAIGAALACPDRTVVCFSGDGSILMNLQEFATAAEQRVNVKVVLMNNRSLGLVYQQQTLFYGRRTFASEYAHVPDFVALMRGFGVGAVDLDRAVDPARAPAAAVRARGPCLVHATIATAEQVLPMVPPGAANTQMILSEETATATEGIRRAIAEG
ncbi:MAG TPA: acetolactate synthase large subunit [Gammaproteobacteria bacterium]|nr:acetolactate synthase large subunit [Gammaproteobacteria bacterium]